MNETPADKKPQTSKPDDKLTRVPVKHMFFAENLDLAPGGAAASMISNLKCYADPPQASRYATCDWIPAWQMFEITHHLDKAEDVIEYLQATFVKRWKRA